MDLTFPGRLHDAVSLVCPITGIDPKNQNDRSTWVITYAVNATEQQKTAATQALLNFDVLESKKATLKEKVDEAAERVRLRYITPGAGMMMTYQEKFAQAQAVNGMGQEAANGMTQQQRESQFPTLSASVGLEAATLWDCAQLVLTKYAQFAALSKVIEGTRLAGKKAISDASDAAAAQAAYEAITWPT